MLHVFFDSGFAHQCWLKFGYVVDMMNVESAPDWLRGKLCDETNENFIKITTIVWGVWFARKKRVWEGKHLTPEITMDLSLKKILEWQAAMLREKESAGEGVYRMASPVVKWETLV